MPTRSCPRCASAGPGGRASSLAVARDAEPEQHEHDAEPEHEQRRRADDAPRLLARSLFERRQVEAGDHREVGGHERQHARREERDDPAAERGEIREDADVVEPGTEREQGRRRHGPLCVDLPASAPALQGCRVGCAAVGRVTIGGVWPARKEMFDLSGKVAVLTGVGSGIGKASAITLAAAGATIVGGDIDEAAAQATADEIEGRRRRTCRCSAPTSRSGPMSTRSSTVPRPSSAGSTSSATSPASRTTSGRRVHRRGVRTHPRDQPEERVLRVSGRDPAHDPAGLGMHREHLVGRDRHACADARVLRHDQGRGRDAHQDARDGGRAARHPRRTRSRRE